MKTQTVKRSDRKALYESGYYLEWDHNHKSCAVREMEKKEDKEDSIWKAFLNILDRVNYL